MTLAQSDLDEVTRAEVAAQLTVDEAEAGLEAARAGGDQDEITAAEEALAAAGRTLGAAQDAVTAAATALEDAEVAQAVLSDEEVGETRGLADLLLDVSYGRDFETEAQFDEYLTELRSDDLVTEYAGLVEELADACFVFDEDDDVVVVPAAPTAKPVTARASFTG